MMMFDWWQCFGSCLSRSPRQLTLLLVGINNAGKTTLLNSLKGDVLCETVPTYGFNTADITAPACTFKLYDLGGGRSIRRIWSVYAPEVHGVIYVVDSADPASFPEARSALQQLLAAPQLAGKPLLLFANKQDLPGAQPLEAVAAAMSLPELQAHQNNPCTAVACTAQGTAQQQHADPALRQGLQWLQATIDLLYGQLQAKVVREAAAAKAEEEQRRQERQERAKHSKLAREKQELQQQHQQTEQQHTTRLQVHQPDKQLIEYVDLQAGQQLQVPEQLIPASWLGSEQASWRASQQISSTQLACSECTPMDHSTSAALPAVPGGFAATAIGDYNTAAAAAADAVSLAAASSCTSASTASTRVPELPSIADKQCSQLAAPASAAAAAAASQPPATSGGSASLLNLLQAAVSLPGSATAAPPAAPEFCDLRQVAHDLCGPTPRSHSISSDTSSLVLSEASQLRPKAVSTTSSMQHHGKAASAAAAGSRRVSGAGAVAGGANARRGSSSTAQGKAAIQLPRKVARSTSLPVSDTGLFGGGSPPVGIAEHGTAPRRTTSSKTSVSNRVQPIA